jgi:hypothetical protein
MRIATLLFSTAIIALLLAPAVQAREVQFMLGLSGWNTDWNRETDWMTWNAEPAVLWGPMLGLRYRRFTLWGQYYGGSYDVKLPDQNRRFSVDRTDVDIQIRYRIVRFLHLSLAYKSLEMYDLLGVWSGGQEQQTIEQSLAGLGIGFTASHVIPRTPVSIFGAYIYNPFFEGYEIWRQEGVKDRHEFEANGFNGEGGLSVFIARIRTSFSLAYRVQEIHLDFQRAHGEWIEEKFSGLKFTATVII